MKVRGINAVAYIFDGGVWKLYVCATNIELSVNTEFIETSVSGSGLWATYAPTKNSFTLSLSGVVDLDETGTLSLPDLRQKQITQETLLLRFQRTDDSGNVYTGVYADELNFFITNSTDAGPFDGMNTFTITGQGTGALTQIFTPIVPVPVGTGLVYRYEFTATANQTTLTDATLIGKTILEFNIDGLGAGKIITSGTPVGTEVKYISVTGEFDWAIPAEDGEEGYILYQ
jgi:hypothetical protein